MLQLKTAWRDGTTRIVMSPLQFLHRLAALALLNDRFSAPSLAERMHELGRMEVYATYVSSLPFAAARHSSADVS